MAELVGIWRAPARRVPMESLEAAEVVEDGVEGCAHRRAGKRSVLFVASEDLDAVGVVPGVVRENFTVRGADLMRWPIGQRVAVGEAEFEVSMVCDPCHLMEEIRPGLQAELEGRRGMLASVVTPGRVAVGDAVRTLSAVTRQGAVAAVSRSPTHTLAKAVQPSIRLRAGLGVEGDAHLGETVRHRSRVARDPTRPNLRQVHLIHAELHEELAAAGLAVAPGEMGENVTTRGVDLLALPAGTRLRLGADALVEVTGLRNPCVQLDGIRPGLMAATLARDEEGGLVRKAGVMGVVLAGGEVRPGDAIRVELPPEPHRALTPV